MWLSHSGGRAWSCDQCRENPDLRRKRGNCGGPFQRGLPASRVDDQGVYVMGYRIAPDSGEAFSELEVRRCPVALSNQVAPIVVAYRRHRAGLYHIDKSYPSPSCALVEAIDILHYSTEEAHYRAQERAMKEAHHGTKSS